MFIKINLWSNLNYSYRNKLIATLIVPEDKQRTSPRNVFLFVFLFDLVTTSKTFLGLALLKPKDIIKFGKMHF